MHWVSRRTLGTTTKLGAHSILEFLTANKSSKILTKYSHRELKINLFTTWFRAPTTGHSNYWKCRGDTVSSKHLGKLWFLDSLGSTCPPCRKRTTSASIQKPKTTGPLCWTSSYKILFNGLTCWNLMSGSYSCAAISSTWLQPLKWPKYKKMQYST